MKRLLPLLILLAVMAETPAMARNHWWFGGGIGLSFGDVDYISIEPVIGYVPVEKVSVGARLIYRYRDDGRFDPSVSATDYGASLFARYLITKPVFVQAEYEYLSYEFRQFNGSTDREGFGSWLAGVGISQPLGRNVSFFVLGLYNFSFSDDEFSPYNDAWVLRLGVGVSF